MLVQAEGVGMGAEAGEHSTSNGNGGECAGGRGRDSNSNVRGAMEAAHEAIRAFFVLHVLLEGEAGVWWVFCHRAFTEALVLADLLKRCDGSDNRDWGGRVDGIAGGRRVDGTPAGGRVSGDPLFAKAKTDVVRMIKILEAGMERDEVARTRVEVLRKYL